MTRVPFLKVTWLDASDPQGDSSWYTEAEVRDFGKKDTVVASFGFAVERTSHYLTLIADITPGRGKLMVYSRPTKIPVKCITKEEKLFIWKKP
jgi:hypothetical protein